MPFTSSNGQLKEEILLRKYYYYWKDSSRSKTLGKTGFLLALLLVCYLATSLLACDWLATLATGSSTGSRGEYPGPWALRIGWKYSLTMRCSAKPGPAFHEVFCEANNR
uniref:Uncharacterized protein n=1 Tax=Picea glauca TaxID=3330 RepID=A0A117NIY0_PICGL|nr:hypothetical protein ABT39_MTgene549 [Picea glauca]